MIGEIDFLQGDLPPELVGYLKNQTDESGIAASTEINQYVTE
jgi:hypothetical protein